MFNNIIIIIITILFGIDLMFSNITVFKYFKKDYFLIFELVIANICFIIFLICSIIAIKNFIFNFTALVH